MHSCKLLVVSCLDYRFQEALRKFLNRQGCRNNYDLICLAGSAGNIVSPTPDRKKAVLAQIIKLPPARRLADFEVSPALYWLKRPICS